MTVLLCVGVLGALLSAIGYCRKQLSAWHRTSFKGREWLEDTQAGTGSSMRILVRSSETGGEYFKLQTKVRATASSAAGPEGKVLTWESAGKPPGHRHKTWDEETEVLEGLLGHWQGNSSNQSTHGPGDKVLVPAGVDHAFWNADPSRDVQTVVKVSPGFPTELVFETFQGLGHDYGDMTKVNPLQLLLTLGGNDAILAGVPPPMWWAIDKLMLPAIRLLGLKPVYHEYSSAPES